MTTERPNPARPPACQRGRAGFFLPQNICGPRRGQCGQSARSVTPTRAWGACFLKKQPYASPGEPVPSQQAVMRHA